MASNGRSRRLVRCVRRGAGALALSTACVITRPAFAGGGAATDAYEGVREGAAIDVHGLVDLYAQHALGRPPFLPVQLRAFDVRSDTLSLSFARLTVARRPNDDLGFRVDAGVGDMPDDYLRSDPAAAAHPEISRVLSYVEQAFVTARARVGRGVAIDAGKFGTPVGLEDNETQLNWNTSRSLLYTWAEPTAHTGLRATVRASDTLALSAFWVNGWNANVLGGNGMRSFAGAASWHPAQELDAGVVYMGGLERAPQRLADPTLSFRHVLDVYATYSPTARVSLAVTADYGRDAAVGGVSWWGVGGYAVVRPTPWLAGALRGEHYADREGFTTGAAQRLAELTATIELKGHLHDVTVVGRLEYRRDRSDARVFDTGSAPPSTHQDTIGLGLMAFF
jgi:hypothetical protein